MIREAVDYELYLVYKAGGTQQAGTRRELPLPLTDTETTAAGTTYADTGRAPDTLELSADGGTLTYSYRFDTALADQTGGEIHRAGVYRYTVNLAAGSCTQTIDPL